MTQTAEAIASGDLSRRVDRAEHHTEVGRLGVALNKMLGEIEESFDERRLSEERLRRFVADASHELRTPLTSIRGYAELWRQGGLRTESELADAMRRMEQEGARMGLLVDDMLLLARLDQGRPLEVGPVDLVGLVNDTVTDARAVEPSRPISVATSVDGPLVVDGDESRLHQVLNNILANVRDHTPPGTPTHVTLGAADGVASVVVSDDGPGFGAEPERVFERFYRADPARSRAHGSSGLGLSIVASLVAAHGGEVSAGASASGGAEVRVSLPLASRIATSPPAADAPSTPAAAASEQFA
jgi:two-component system OmpR family sensor kinase